MWGVMGMCGEWWGCVGSDGDVWLLKRLVLMGCGEGRYFGWGGMGRCAEWWGVMGMCGE